MRTTDEHTDRTADDGTSTDGAPDQEALDAPGEGHRADGDEHATSKERVALAMRPPGSTPVSAPDPGARHGVDEDLDARIRRIVDQALHEGAGDRGAVREAAPVVDDHDSRAAAGTSSTPDRTIVVDGDAGEEAPRPTGGAGPGAGADAGLGAGSGPRTAPARAATGDAGSPHPDLSPQRASTSAAATTALVVGVAAAICALLSPLALLALGLGSIAVLLGAAGIVAARVPGTTGRVLALAGLVLGLLAAVVGAITLLDGPVDGLNDPSTTESLQQDVDDAGDAVRDALTG